MDEAIDHLETQEVARRHILREHDTNDISQLREAEPGEPLPAHHLRSITGRSLHIWTKRSFGQMISPPLGLMT
ncbi:hypothetical protein ABT294_14950 [Nonomuraea sp. NPDC000554]|uniref:hypothetical protein n=1 Tax=Nonomuraea sp. NPDC000554 TaxID=3154259 RepID=UPI003320E19E